VVAAGRGSRFGAAENKVLLPLAGVPIWVRSIEALQACSLIGTIVLVVRACDRSGIEPEANKLGVIVVEGGEQRYDSVRAGLDALAAIDSTAPWVAVHDAARPLVPLDDVLSVIKAAAEQDAAILATPLRGTIKRGTIKRGKGKLGEGELGEGKRSPIETVDRTDLWEALTPQVFATAVLRNAYTRHRGRPVTDDAELVERSGTPVCLVPGSAENLKITQAEDLIIAEAIFSQRKSQHVSRTV
jgi:2-C-methyl-D-erythritol 4-phosphate cytidylyltransferase